MIDLVNLSLWTTVIGWGGTVLMVGAYFLVSTNRVKSSAVSYQLMNLFGAIGLGLNVWHQKAWPALAFELLWVVIAMYALIKRGNPMDMGDLSES